MNAGFRPAFRFAFDAGWAWAERQKATERVADLRTWAAFGVALPECLRTEKELRAQREQDQREQDPTARGVSRPAPATRRRKPQRATAVPDEPAPDEFEEDAP